jgi:hypothetical protein
MAESWVRLWSGSTTDPKWQTIARKSGQPRYLVIALFTHLLMVANEAEPRGDISGMSIEDAASALDCDEEQVALVMEAMGGRVIEGTRLAGWEKRQVFREDIGNDKTGALSSTERSRLHRERKRYETEIQADATQGKATQGNATQRDATQGNAPEADTEADTDTEVNQESASTTQPVGTLGGLVCARLKAECGFYQTNPQHPKLLALLAAGITPDEFVSAGMDAREGKSFNWILATAEGRRRDAAAVGTLPPARGSPPTGRRQTLTETRAETIAALTGRNLNNERTNTAERDITGESTRVE